MALGVAGYEKPKITPMEGEEVLAAFQMTASQIAAAGCWWAPCPGGGAPACTAKYGAKSSGRPGIGPTNPPDPIHSDQFGP